MILDSSVIVLILLRQAGWEEWLERLASAPSLASGAPTLVETSMVLASRTALGDAVLRAFIQKFAVRVLPFEAEHWSEAARAHLRFGRGRHRAGLNFGDCMSYAVAKLSGMPLAYVGNDFAETDLAAV